MLFFSDHVIWPFTIFIIIFSMSKLLEGLGGPGGSGTYRNPVAEVQILAWETKNQADRRKEAVQSSQAAPTSPAISKATTDVADQVKRVTTSEKE